MMNTMNKYPCNKYRPNDDLLKYLSKTHDKHAKYCTKHNLYSGTKSDRI